MENIVYIGSSICSAICSKTSTAPLERIKVLKQSQFYYKNSNYNTLLGSFSYIYKNEGFYGLFKGNLINIYRVFPAYILHSILPVTKNVRYALVGWVHGPSFR